MKTLFVAFLVTLCSNAFALSTYYPAEFKQKITEIRDEELKQEIFKVLDMKHIGGRNEDTLVSNCSQGQGRCYSQRVLGYTAARKIMFGKLYLSQDEQGQYFVRDVYCQEHFKDGVGPDRIPNHNRLNCEHTWPQSKFNSRFPNEMQKSDLHHLYPTDSKANSIRGNNEFGDVENEGYDLCGTSQVGRDSYTGGGHYFEPPAEHKGNVARSLFYFSVRYKLPISERQEATLRRWHAEDPVDAEELERNEQIHYIQGNRNPFIDLPELTGLISDF